MKISIRWIFDHIESNWTSVDIPQLVKLFNEKTAEIEHIEHVVTDVSRYSLVRIVEQQEQDIVVYSDEWKKEIRLPHRADICKYNTYMVIQDAQEIRWALVTDFSCVKEGLFPAISASTDWKKLFEAEDYIFHVDNKSITHRPDLWGHRGLAREVAALLDLPLKKEDYFLSKKSVKNDLDAMQGTVENPFSLFIQDKQHCKRFAGLYFNALSYHVSSLWMAHRLARVDARPIDFIVDATNYAMFDVSQPLHAFDAAHISGNKIGVKRAENNQRLTLLDDQDIVLTERDMVIVDDQKIVSLAGIMGGKETGIQKETTQVFLEAANFDATTIRHTSLRFKVRSQASARFEKSLDPNQNITGILRFISLLDKEGISYQCAPDILSLGATINPIQVTLTHNFIEQSIGAHIEKDFIVRTLEKIDFKVTEDAGIYTVTIPTFRATKDISIKEDVVEEIARFYGYSSIPVQLPEKQTKAHSLEQVYRLRSIKQLCAYSMIMREVFNYAFFDESFLAQMQWNPEKAVEIKNPISENNRRLITTLVPGLLKCLLNNSTQEQMRFFEWARVWHNDVEIQEKQMLSAILFDKKHIAFYEAKSLLGYLFDFLHMPVEWHKIDEPKEPWFMPYQTAHIMLNNEVIGIAGKVNKSFLQPLIEGEAFIFELNADALLDYAQPQERYEAPSKYPSVERDISMLVPLQITVRHIIQAIKAVDTRISGIQLIDMFDKKEWSDQRSLTFRFIIQAEDRTLTKEDADDVWHKVAQSVKDLGATIR